MSKETQMQPGIYFVFFFFSFFVCYDLSLVKRNIIALNPIT